MASFMTRGELGKGFPRNVALMELTEFEKFPYRALIQAAGGDWGTLIHTVGRIGDGPGGLGRVEVAVIVPASEYRRLIFKAGESEGPA